MSDGAREARVAARWWADQLMGRDSDVRTGDAMNEAFAMYVRSKIPSPTSGQVEAFRAHLEESLREVALGDDWREAVERGEPRRGAALRAFGVDYGPARILDDALVAAGLDQPWRKSLLPMKTTMWFNPGEVKVSLGYDGPERAINLDDGTLEPTP